MALKYILAASLLIAPMPKNGINFAGPNDYPNDMLRGNKSVRGEVELIVSPDGKIESCALLSFAGDKNFSGRLCNIVQRKSFEAGLDATGKPVYGRTRTTMTFFTPDSRTLKEVMAHKDKADLIIEMPAGTLPDDMSLDIYLTVLIAENGKVEACSSRPEPLNKGITKNVVDEACEGIKQIGFGPIQTEIGPVERYVSHQMVRFRNGIEGAWTSDS